MNIKAHACIGGKSIGEDIKALDRGVHVVSGTPGRVYDMIRRRNLVTRNLKMLVIDEADEMFNRGFKNKFTTYIATCPRRRRWWSSLRPASGSSVHDRVLHERPYQSAREA